MPNHAGLTVSCPIAALDFQIKNKNPYVEIYHEIVSQMNSECISAIQLYPASWPRKLKITFSESKIKTDVLIKGLILFGKNVEFDDDNNLMTRIIVRDGSAEWDDEIFEGLISEYANVVKVEKEMIYIEGVKTNCTTGARYVYVTAIRDPIPSKLELCIEGKVHYLSAWHKGQGEKNSENKLCALCGGNHKNEDCSHKKKVCFTCQGDDHTQKNCPQNKGVKIDDENLIFYNSKCVLSNWNTEYPFRVNGQEYICVEQYVNEEKAYNFGDSKAAQQIRDASDPREMKRIGEHIRNYDHREWATMVADVTYRGLQAKFSDEQARGAKDFLLSTGTRILGEASRNDYWGTGLHISDPNALKSKEWTGSNTSGRMLMKIRSKIQEIDKPKPENKDVDTEDKKTDVNLDNSFDKVFADNKPRHRWAIVLGDSNTPDQIEESTTEIPVKVKNLSKGGMKLEHISEVTKTCMLPKDDVDFAMMQLGACEWHTNSELKDADLVFSDYIQALNTINESYPNAEYVISGIPLRDPKNENDKKIHDINSEIVKVNQKLEDFASKETNVTFVNNSDIKISNETQKSQHYRDSIHLSQEGSQILLTNLRKGLCEGVASSMLNIWSQVRDNSPS